MKISLSLFAAAILVMKISAQEPLSQPGATVEIDSIGVAHVTIPTISGRTYFTRISTDLENWTYLSDIVEGDGTDHCYCFSPTQSKLFVVFEHSDYVIQFPGPADFDFDGFSNAVELQNNTSPIEHTPGGGIAPLADPVVPVGSSFVLRKITLNDNVSPKRVVEDYPLDFGFNHTGNANNWPIEYERETPDVLTRIQLFGQAGGVEAKLSMVDRSNSFDAQGNESPLAAPRDLTIPANGDRSNVFTYGSEGATGLVGTLSPVEISVTFGITDRRAIPTPRGNLLTYLNTAGTVGDNAVDVWVVPRMVPVLDEQGDPVLDAEGNPEMEVQQFFGVEIASTETPLRRALSGDGKIVVFDGHSNFGIGPNFVVGAHKPLAGFTDFGAGSTDIGRKFVGDGTEEAGFLTEQMLDDIEEWDAIPPSPTGEKPPYPFQGTAEQTQALGRFGMEGYAYITLLPNEIPNQRNNYNVPFLNILRYENDQGRGHGQAFTINGAGTGRWHMTGPDGTTLIILVDGDRVPTPLQYETYFYNACSTGRDYIEVFEQPYPAGNFMFTNRACWVGTATHEFVRMRIEGMTNQQIVDDMNARDLAQTPGQINDFEVR